MQPTEAGDAVAIIGMAGRFPGARDIRQFWANLASGVESITIFADPEAHDATSRAWRVNAGGAVDDIDLFDADFFAVPPAEAAWMDPQHRLFLECAWLALEDAGCDPSALPAAVAVYAGTNINTYALDRLDQLAGKERAQFMQILVGNEKDFLATRVSYKLNLRGESVTVQTSCSTSLVALHLACQSLLSGQSDRALAGGVSIRVPQLAGYTFEAGLIASPDGHCRPFDHRARGTVPGNGVGVVVLKRLEDAIADRDHCYAVIRGSWINNDGRGKVGFTAPAVEGQTEVIARAMAMAGASPDSIRFVETHGTGTPIGDPIEFEALRRAFRPSTRRRSCALGAVKANIGHLDTAAGIAGLMKVALALHHRVVPPASHFERPNPVIDFENSRFYVNTEPETWEAGEEPRRGAVSSFGVGGTNVHVVVEEAPARRRTAEPRPVQIMTVSARTAESLRAGAQALADFVETSPRVELRDIAYARNVGRQQFARRRFVVAASARELATALRVEAHPAEATRTPPSIVFMFTGQGAQRVGMGHALYVDEPRFRDAIERSLGRVDRSVAQTLRELICMRRGGDAAAELARPELALPALLAVEYALVQVWTAWGVVPGALIGHSYGELIAACIGGVFSVEDAMDLAIERGRLMQRMPPGRMLAVPLPASEAARWVDQQVTLASINGDERVVLSGPIEAIGRVQQGLAARGIATQWLNVPFAYHSTLLDPLLDDYRAIIGRAARRPLTARCMSNLTADWLTNEQASDPQYWAAQMRQPVRFAEGLRRMREDGHTMFVEVGPGQTLAGLARQVLGRGVTVCGSLARESRVADADWRAILDTLGRLWSAGIAVDWREVERAQQGWLVPVPGYAFARRRHWIDTRQPDAATDVDPLTRVAMPGLASPPLPAPTGAADHRAGIEGDPAASFREQVERTLVGIWSEVLGRPTVAVDDDFFELGGDSLTATRILSRLQQALPVAVTMEQVLTSPTIAALARVLEPAERIEAPAPSPEAQVLSHAQEWLWTEQRLAPGSPAYHLPLAVRLRGPFDSATFAAAIGDVVARQDELRTVFVLDSGRPTTVVRPRVEVSVPIVDLSECRGDRQEAVARHAGRCETTRLFDLSQAPPWRACLLRLGVEDHVVLFLVHHIIADGWSMSLLVNEVTTAYVARQMGAPRAQPPLAMQYRDFARQQRADLERDSGALVAFWKQRLAGVPPLLSLSARPRPAVRSFHGGRHPFLVAPPVVDRLSELGRRERATLFMVTLAAYQALLFRLTGQEDFCVGAPTAGRVHREMEGIIGCFMNTLPIRANLEGNPTFVELLQRVRRTTLDAFTHQALPFGRIVHELRPPRNPSYTPLFQVVFDFNSTPPPAPPQWPALAVEPFGAPMPTAKTDLIVDLWRGEAGELLGAFEYDRALFDAADIERMAEGFQTLLDAVSGGPDRRVGSLPIESDEHRARRVQAERERDAARRERLTAIKGGGRRSHVTHSH